MAKALKTKKAVSKLPDPDGQNRDRADWALAAVAAFQDETGLKAGDGLGTAIMDLIGNLGHLCDRKRLNLAELIAAAKHHYDAETESQGKQFEEVTA